MAVGDSQRIWYNQSQIYKRIDISIKLDSNNYSVFSLRYHLVLVVKYRREVFTDEISDFAKDMFIEIGKKYYIILTEWI